MNTEKGYRYYSVMRPLSIGCYPNPQGNKILNIENFDDKKFCKDVGKDAWGYIEYEQPVSDVLLQDYELVARH